MTPRSKRPAGGGGVDEQQRECTESGRKHHGVPQKTVVSGAPVNAVGRERQGVDRLRSRRDPPGDGKERLCRRRHQPARHGALSNQHETGQQNSSAQAPGASHEGDAPHGLDAAGAAEVADQALGGGRVGVQEQGREQPHLPDGLMGCTCLRADPRGRARRQEEEEGQEPGPEEQVPPDNQEPPCIGEWKMG